MRPEKQEQPKKPSPKDIETMSPSSILEEEDFVKKDMISMDMAEKMLSLGQAYTETGLDETGTEVLRVYIMSNKELIYSTNDYFDIEELKKVEYFSKGGR